MSIERDILFLLKPGFVDDGGRWFCPYSAQVVGVLEYFPQARATLDIREVDFPRPRRAIVELIGEDLQSCPVLVLADHATVPADVADKVILSKGRRVISETISILRYLALTRHLPLPH